ncbi:MAG: hypothetical protein ACPLX8_00825, partial [Nanopusillaceae archaeon]
AMNALRKVYNKIRSENLSEHEALEKIKEMKITVTMEDFAEALKKVRPSITKEMLDYYKMFSETFRTNIVENMRQKYYG